MGSTMNTKTIATALTATFLFACSGGDESSPSGPTTQPAGTNGNPSEMPSGQPCSDQSSAKTASASPVAKCTGLFRGNDGQDYWLHRNQQSCLLGTTYVLHEDGKATDTFRGKSGIWEGDEFNFRVDFGSLSLGFQRLPAEPSK